MSFESSNFSIALTPNIPDRKGRHLLRNETLDFEDFGNITDEYFADFLFADRSYNYGHSSLYQIYVDICDEMDKLYIGGSHDFEMSYYPVLRIIDLMDGNITTEEIDTRLNGTFTIFRCNRVNVADVFFDMKKKIEEYVTFL